MPCYTRMKTIVSQGLLWFYLLEIGFMVVSLEPGYLDFDNLPDTNFSCEKKVIGGYYADLETSCQMFHVCTVGQHNEPMDIRFLCLNGTVFDQETRVCERIDEVDCTKSETFYDLNLELYGNVQPPILGESPETKSSLQSTTTTTTTTTPKSHYYSTSGPTTLHSKHISLHHFPVDTSSDFRFNPEEINVKLNPSAPPDIRTKPISFQQQSFSDEKNKQIIVTTHTTVYKGGAKPIATVKSNVPIDSQRISGTTNHPTAIDYDFIYQHHTDGNLEYHTKVPEHPYHYQNFPSTGGEHFYKRNLDVFKSSTFKTLYPSTTTPPILNLHQHSPTTFQSQDSFVSSKNLAPEHYQMTEKPYRVQLPLPVLPAFTISTPSPFIRTHQMDSKRYNDHHTPRIIISASASVSDHTGRKLNQSSFGTITDTQYFGRQPPASYDDYKEDDISLDPFYHDVPKVHRRQKRNSQQNNSILKTEEEAAEVLKFLLNWYTNYEKTTKIAIPLTSDAITEINNELSSLSDISNNTDDQFNEINANKSVANGLQGAFNDPIDEYEYYDDEDAITENDKKPSSDKNNYEEANEDKNSNATPFYGNTENVTKWTNVSEELNGESTGSEYEYEYEYDEDDHTVETMNTRDKKALRNIDVGEGTDYVNSLHDKNKKSSKTYIQEEQNRKVGNKNWNDTNISLNNTEILNKQMLVEIVDSTEKEQLNETQKNTINNVYNQTYLNNEDETTIYTVDNDKEFNDQATNLSYVENESNNEDEDPNIKNDIYDKDLINNGTMIQQPPYNPNDDIDNKTHMLIYAEESDVPLEDISGNYESLNSTKNKNVTETENGLTIKQSIKTVIDDYVDDNYEQQSFKEIKSDSMIDENGDQVGSLLEEYVDDNYEPLTYKEMRDDYSDKSDNVKTSENIVVNNTTEFSAKSVDMINSTTDKNMKEFLSINLPTSEITLTEMKVHQIVEAIAVDNENETEHKQHLEEQDKGLIFETTPIATHQNENQYEFNHTVDTPDTTFQSNDQLTTYLPVIDSVNYDDHEEISTLGVDATTETYPTQMATENTVSSTYSYFEDFEANTILTTARNEINTVDTTYQTYPYITTSSMDMQEVFSNTETTPANILLTTNSNPVGTTITENNFTDDLPGSTEQLQKMIKDIETTTRSIATTIILPSTDTELPLSTDSVTEEVLTTNHEISSTLMPTISVTTNTTVATIDYETTITTPKTLNTTTAKSKQIHYTRRPTPTRRNYNRFGAQNRRKFDRKKSIIQKTKGVFNSSAIEKQTVGNVNNNYNSSVENNLNVTSKYVNTNNSAKPNEAISRSGAKLPFRKYKDKFTVRKDEGVTDPSLTKSANPTLPKETKHFFSTTPLSRIVKITLRKERLKKNFVFNCFDKKMSQFYSDPRDCRLFHYCSPGYTSNQLLDMKFVCDLGTYFDEVKLTCTKEKPARCS